MAVLAAAPVRRPFHHAAQRVVVGTAAGPLTVLGTHLDPYSGTRRLVEAGWAAGAVRTDRDGLALLAGDLNTLDPYAEHADRVGRLPPGYRRRHLRRDGRTVETRAVARLLAAGLVDLGADAGPTVPTAHGGAEFPDVRLDYLLATPTLATHLTHVEVVRTPHTDHASDHYPLVAEFALTPPARSQEQVEQDGQDDRGDEGEEDHQEAADAAAGRSDLRVTESHRRSHLPVHRSRSRGSSSSCAQSRNIGWVSPPT
ncbi:hypothetical protein [Verrucosispora sioxanthis]|uniref:hypothetical protein n=1 Tax=Verrucosispora sioxanthis TaxID=2499994 RepID=UPI0020A067C3|nr:hypothetical protein [Verrucosispora sioxanthis]